MDYNTRRSKRHIPTPTRRRHHRSRRPPVRPRRGRRPGRLPTSRPTAKRPPMANIDGLAMAGADAAKPEADPFDLASLRLSQDFASAVGVKTLITDGPGQETVERVVCPDPSRSGLSAPNGRLGAERGSGDLSGLSGSLAGAGRSEKTFSPRLLVDCHQPTRSFVSLADPAPRVRWQDRRLEPVRDGRGR